MFRVIVVYSITAKSWRILHGSHIVEAIWNESRGVHSTVSERSWIRVSDMYRQIPNVTVFLDQSPTVEILDLNYPPPHPQPATKLQLNNANILGNSFIEA